MLSPQSLRSASVQMRLTSFACTPLQGQGESMLSPCPFRSVFMRPGLRPPQACLRHVEDGRRRKRMQSCKKCGSQRLNSTGNRSSRQPFNVTS